MPTPRRLQVDPDVTPYYHCISRCVRRAFLCGDDSFSGRNFDHRKGWLVDRMMELAAVFAIDVCAYGVMSNHFHLIPRIVRERARAWSDDEVVQRYGRVFPSSVEGFAERAERVRRRRVAQWRTRLSDLSWYMRCLNESIARRANREDRCTGRFWEGRFRSQALLDEGALLACMSYVDLNPIRAGLATTLEGSQFTSIRERLLEVSGAGPGAPDDARRNANTARLAPMAGDAPEADESNGERAEARVEPLPIGLRDYVELLDWTRRSSRAEDPVAAGPMVEPVLLRRAGLDPAGFVTTVREYSRTFFGMAGQVHRIEAESERRGYRRRLGLRGARRLYGAAA